MQYVAIDVAQKCLYPERNALTYPSAYPGEDEWQYTPEPPERERDYNWINVTDLEPNGEYEFIVVAVNKLGNETESEPTVIVVTPPGPGKIHVNRVTLAISWNGVLFIFKQCGIKTCVLKYCVTFHSDYLGLGIKLSKL